MNRLRTYIGGYDWIMLAALILLTSIGLAAVYSVDLSRGSTLIFFPTQVVSVGIGMLLCTTASLLHKTRFESSAQWFYLFGLALLILVLFLGTHIRGTTGWFRVAGFSFQPAEFAKVALVLLLGWWFSRQARRFDRWEFIVSTTLALGLYVGLIMMQPDLGQAFVLVGLWFGLLLLCGIPKRYTLGFLSAAAILLVCAWFFLFEGYQKERIYTFLHPERDPLGSGYNVMQSIIAIGSGQFYGRGLGFGSQSQLHFLPEAQTDFIISVIGEELGFIGINAVIFLYGIVIWRLIRLTRLMKDDFSVYTLLGIALLFFIQMTINIGGASGLLPVTGVTLPFISYGGSSVIMNWFLIGVALSISRSHTERPSRQYSQL